MAEWRNAATATGDPFDDYINQAIQQGKIRGPDGTVVGTGTFGSDTTVQMPNSLAVMVNALRLQLTLPVATSGSEESRWTWTGLKAGAVTIMGGAGFDLASLPMIFVSDPANRHGLRLNGSASELIHGGTQVLTTSGTTCTIPSFNIALTNKLNQNRAAGSVSVNTLTLGTADTSNVTGTPTINGIVTSGMTAGRRFVVQLLNGATLVNSSGAPGGGAVDLKLVGAANIAVGAQGRAVAFMYDGTFCYQEG